MNTTLGQYRATSKQNPPLDVPQPCLPNWFFGRAVPASATGLRGDHSGFAALRQLKLRRHQHASSGTLIRTTPDVASTIGHVRTDIKTRQYIAGSLLTFCLLSEIEIVEFVLIAGRSSTNSVSRQTEIFADGGVCRNPLLVSSCNFLHSGAHNSSINLSWNWHSLSRRSPTLGSILSFVEDHFVSMSSRSTSPKRSASSVMSLCCPLCAFCWVPFSNSRHPSSPLLLCFF